ncbi:DUF4349 domain-containing protein [Streptomyces sp. NPDC091385]|uniref:DUF4349 domain-containing protein n=1 Tax=unclassified Streptomyces TaxID=2593676 RepID=UPI0018F3722C|nr:DUF4349 domain-containing protein [Streptomyces sp. DSM 110735]MBJ7904259.1 DUF4349 domain-containing protein [Streptomyces sp. DSM 110735]
MRASRSFSSARNLAGALLVASLALAGCSAAGGGSDASGKSMADGPARQSGAAGAGGGASDAKTGDRRVPRVTASAIIRTASLTVQVKDVPKALDDARTTTEDAGGFVGDETTTRDAGGHERTRVVLRVPTAKYDEVMTALQGTGKLLERNAKAEDVTDQVVDVESRIKSQRASVARVRELMDRAEKLSDVVALEGELSTRESDLESLLAQQSSLKDRTSLATITLSLSATPVHKAAAKDDDPGFLDALSGGWSAFLATLRWVTVVVGAVLPFAALAAVLAFLWLRLVRPRLRKRRTGTTPPHSGS